MPPSAAWRVEGLPFLCPTQENGLFRGGRQGEGWKSQTHHLSGQNNLSKQLPPCLTAHSSDSAALSLAESVLPELLQGFKPLPEESPARLPFYLFKNVDDTNNTWLPFGCKMFKSKHKNKVKVCLGHMLCLPPHTLHPSSQR